MKKILKVPTSQHAYKDYFIIMRSHLKAYETDLGKV